MTDLVFIFMNDLGAGGYAGRRVSGRLAAPQPLVEVEPYPAADRTKKTSWSPSSRLVFPTPLSWPFESTIRRSSPASSRAISAEVLVVRNFRREPSASLSVPVPGCGRVEVPVSATPAAEAPRIRPRGETVRLYTPAAAVARPAL